MTNTATSDETLQAQVQQLWSANFLNIRRATEQALQQGRSRIDIGLELIHTTHDSKGAFFTGARECLVYLSKSSTFGLHLWTIASPEKVQLLMNTQFDPAQISFHGKNTNPLHTNIAWDQRKPWFDVLLDHTSGFDPGAGQWFWAHQLFNTAAKALVKTVSGAAVVRTIGRFDVRPDTSLHRQRP